MKRTLLYSIFLLILLGIGSCNNKNKDLDRVMNVADSQMISHPDSALLIIQSVDTIGMSQDQFARYALLLTKAYDKQNGEYEKQPLEPLMKRAVTYYKGKNNLEELQSLYYCGNLYYLLHRYDLAMVYMHLANDLAVSLNDKLYEGLSARVLADLYRNLCKFQEELKYCVQAQDAHNQYDSLINKTEFKYGSWLDIMLSRSYNDLKMPDKALEISYRPDSIWYNRDQYFRHQTLKNIAKAYHLLGKYREGLEVYNVLISDGYKMNGLDWCLMSHNAFNIGEISSSFCYLDSAKQCMTDASTSSYIKMLESCFTAEQGDFRRAYEKSRQWEIAYQEATDTLLTSSNLSGVIDLYHTEVQNRELKIELHKKKINWLLIIIFLLFILILFASIAVKNKIKVRKARIILLEHQKEELSRNEVLLHDSMVALVAEATVLKDSLRLKNETEERRSDELKKFINNKVSHLEKAYTNMLRSKATKSKSGMVNAKEMPLFNHISNEDSLESLDHFIDIYSGGTIDNVRQLCPSLSLRQLRILRYMYVGLSSEIIIALTQMPSSGSFRTEKHRIKDTILREGGENAIQLWTEFNSEYPQ